MTKCMGILANEEKRSAATNLFLGQHDLLVIPYLYSTEINFNTQIFLIVFINVKESSEKTSNSPAFSRDFLNFSSLDSFLQIDT